MMISNILNKVENVIKKIEDIFNKKHEISYSRLIKKIEENIEINKRSSMTNFYIPNSFKIFLNRSNYNNILPIKEKIINELIDFIKDYTIINNYELFSNIKIEILESKEGENYLVVSSFENIGTTKEKVIKLVVKNGEEEGKEYIISSFPIKIGRDTSNDIILKDSTKSVSRCHAIIYKEGEDFIIVDNKSTNGIFINNNKIVEKEWIYNKDIIKMGNIIIEFVCE